MLGSCRHLVCSDPETTQGDLHSSTWPRTSDVGYLVDRSEVTAGFMKASQFDLWSGFYYILFILFDRKWDFGDQEESSCIVRTSIDWSSLQRKGSAMLHTNFYFLCLFECTEMSSAT